MIRRKLNDRRRFNFRDEALAQGWSADWFALAAELQVQIRVVPEIPQPFLADNLGDVGYDGRDRVIYFQTGGYEPWVVHEIAHFLVATPEERDQCNYGFGQERLLGDHRSKEAEEAAADLTIALWMFRRGFTHVTTQAAPTTADVCVDLGGGPLWWTRTPQHWRALLWRHVPWSILRAGYLNEDVADSRIPMRPALEPELQRFGLRLDRCPLLTDPRFHDVCDIVSGELVGADLSLADLLLHGTFDSRDEILQVGTVPPVSIALRDGTVLA